jgi:hypothetical protein
VGQHDRNSGLTSPEYTLILTPYIINNLFTLSQANSLFLTKKKITEDAIRAKARADNKDQNENNTS